MGKVRHLTGLGQTVGPAGAVDETPPRVRTGDTPNDWVSRSHGERQCGRIPEPKRTGGNHASDRHVCGGRRPRRGRPRAESQRAHRRHRQGDPSLHLWQRPVAVRVPAARGGRTPHGSRSGRVVQHVGEDVRTLKPGDVVVVPLRTPTAPARSVRRACRRPASAADSSTTPISAHRPRRCACRSQTEPCIACRSARTIR